MTRLMLIEQLICRTGSLSATTSSPMGIRGKEANDFKPNVYRGEKNGETFTAFRMELQNWAGAMHDSMLEVLEIAETKEDRMAEANVRNGGVNQETVDDLQGDGQTTVYRFPRCMHKRSGEERRVRT